MPKTLHLRRRLATPRRQDQFKSYGEVPSFTYRDLQNNPAFIANIDKMNPRKFGAMIAKRALIAAFNEEELQNVTICDMLADLRHLCDADGLDFAELDRRAYQHYCAELYGDKP
jgi:hypothetical protein